MDDMTKIINTIFSGVMKKEEGVEIRRQEFLKTYGNPNVFENEHYIFAVLIRDYGRLQLSENFLMNFLQTNRAILEKSKNINLEKYNISDVEPYVEFANSAKVIYEELQKNTFTKDEFLEALEIYKMNYITEESITLLEEGAKILAEGAKVKGKSKVGYEDMRTHIKTGFIQLDELTNKSERKGIITYGINDIDDEAREKDKIKKICNYGIKGLDEHIGGIWEGEMISLLAPPKGGKSRMSTFILHNAIIEGVNILMWSIENGYKGWEALIRARHFEYFYNQNAVDGSQRKWVSDDEIRKGTLSPEVKDMELASWTDLKSNHTYGKITSIDEDFDVDTFIEVIDKAVEDTNAKLICVDYLQLIQGSGNTAKHEKVGTAYQKMLQYLKMKRLAGIFPAQLKQNFVESLNRVEDADLENVELRASAGESNEVIKTPDVNLSLYATQEEIKQGKMRILSIPSRNHRPFSPIPLNCAMGSCTFTDVKKA